MGKFKVGERALVENEVVTIDDIMQSEKGGVYYAVTFENGNEEGIYSEDELQHMTSESMDVSGYDFKIILTSGLAIVKCSHNGKPLGTSHAHIFHDGEEGVLQAVSYAFKRLWEANQEE